MRLSNEKIIKTWSKLGALPLAEGEGVRSTLLQGTRKTENTRNPPEIIKQKQ